MSEQFPSLNPRTNIDLAREMAFAEDLVRSPMLQAAKKASYFALREYRYRNEVGDGAVFANFSKLVPDVSAEEYSRYPSPVREKLLEEALRSRSFLQRLHELTGGGSSIADIEERQANRLLKDYDSGRYQRSIYEALYVDRPYMGVEPIFAYSQTDEFRTLQQEFRSD